MIGEFDEISNLTGIIGTKFLSELKSTNDIVYAVILADCICIGLIPGAAR